MKILAVIFALVLILVVVGGAAADFADKFDSPPLGETLPINEPSPTPFTRSEMVPVYKVDGKILPKKCPAPFEDPSFECPLEQTADLF